MLFYFIFILFICFQDCLKNGSLCEGMLDVMNQQYAVADVTRFRFDTKKDRNVANSAFFIGLDQQDDEASKHYSAYSILGEDLLASWILQRPHACTIDCTDDSESEGSLG